MIFNNRSQIKSIRDQVHFISRNDTNKRVSFYGKSRSMSRLAKDINYIIDNYNSKELESAANIKSYSGSGALRVRDGMENEKRGELSGKFDRLYASVKEQQLISASAETSLRRAQLTRDQAGRQYALGLLGKAELEARELEVISYEAAVSNARLSLAQAVLNYEWALKGYFD